MVVPAEGALAVVARAVDRRPDSRWHHLLEASIIDRKGRHCLYVTVSSALVLLLSISTGKRHVVSAADTDTLLLLGTSCTAPVSFAQCPCSVLIILSTFYVVWWRCPSSPGPATGSWSV